MEIFNQILKHNQDDKFTRLELGRLYAQQGRNAEAEEQFRQYIT